MLYDSSEFHLSLLKKLPSPLFSFSHISPYLCIYITFSLGCHKVYKQILNLIKVEPKSTHTTSSTDCSTQVILGKAHFSPLICTTCVICIPYEYIDWSVGLLRPVNWNLFCFIFISFGWISRISTEREKIWHMCMRLYLIS